MAPPPRLARQRLVACGLLWASPRCLAVLPFAADAAGGVAAPPTHDDHDAAASLARRPPRQGPARRRRRSRRPARPAYIRANSGDARTRTIRVFNKQRPARELRQPLGAVRRCPGGCSPRTDRGALPVGEAALRAELPGVPRRARQRRAACGHARRRAFPSLLGRRAPPPSDFWIESGRMPAASTSQTQPIRRPAAARRSSRRSRSRRTSTRCTPRRPTCRAQPQEREPLRRRAAVRDQLRGVPHDHR